MSNVKRRMYSSTLGLAVAGALLAGCASTENAALTNAEKVYGEASSDTTLMQNEQAAAHMAAASDALDDARHSHQLRTSFNEPVSKSEVDASAYAAEQHVQAAKEISARDAATVELAKLTAERDAAMVAKNERDAATLAAQEEQARADKALADALDRAKEAGAEIDDSGDRLKVTFRNLTFDSGKADLKPEFKTTLDELAAALTQRYPKATLEVRGYTDSTGPKEFNAQLSEKRAVAVQTFLINQGLSSDRVASKGLGDNDPVADNSTAEGRALNRRVELIVTGGEQLQ